MLVCMATLVTFNACKKTDDTTVADADKVSASFTVYQVVGATATLIKDGATVNLNDSIFMRIDFKGSANNKLKSYLLTASNEKN